jgi:hypothetical protein
MLMRAAEKPVDPPADHPGLRAGRLVFRLFHESVQASGPWETRRAAEKNRSAAQIKSSKSIAALQPVPGDPRRPPSNDARFQIDLVRA